MSCASTLCLDVINPSQENDFKSQLKADQRSYFALSFIHFLATVVPVRNAGRNYQFLQHEFSEESKIHCLGDTAVPFQVSIPTGRQDGDL